MCVFADTEPCYTYYFLLQNCFPQMHYDNNTLVGVSYSARKYSLVMCVLNVINYYSLSFPVSFAIFSLWHSDMGMDSGDTCFCQNLGLLFLALSWRSYLQCLWLGFFTCKMLKLVML